MLRAVALQPATLLQTKGDAQGGYTDWQLLGQADQEMVVSLVVRNADLISSDPGALRGLGQCFPFPASFTLGEHAFAEGLIAAVPWALTGEPILAYNFMLLVGYFLSGIGMFVLVRHFTGSPAAGFVSGLLLQWMPNRLLDGGHPFLHAEFWLPFALLFLHRLFVTGYVRAMLGVAFFLGLQALESFYLILGVVVVVGIYVPFLFWRHSAHRWKALGMALVAGGWVLLIGLFVLGPYLETRSLWPVLQGRDSLLLPIEALLPGRIMFPGWIFSALLLLGLVDRIRRRRSCDGEDPRIPMFCAALLILVCSTYGLRVPGTSIAVPSPLVLLAGIVPGLDAVRALGVMSNIAWVPMVFIAGYGALWVFEWVGPRRARWVLAGLATGIAVTRFVPEVASMTYGEDLIVAARDARPSEAEVSLIREAAPSVVLHLPMAVTGPVTPDGAASEQLLLGSFSPSPTTTCYNSFVSPYAAQVGQLSRHLPGIASIDALAAMGIDTVVLHKRGIQTSGWLQRFLEWFRKKSTESPEVRERIELLGETDRILVYRISGKTPTSSSQRMLSRGMAYEEPWRAGEDRTVRFWARNRGDLVYRDPGPPGYRQGSVLWVDEQGEAVRRDSVEFLMPLALAPGARLGLDVVIEPPPGDQVYLGYLSPANGPWKGFALARVRRTDSAAVLNPED